MYSLSGCFLETDPESKDAVLHKSCNKQLFPLKLKVTSTDLLTIFFDTLIARNILLKTI